MELLKKDLQELNLSPSELSGIFLRLENPDGISGLKRNIAGEYLDLLNRCAPEQRKAIRRLVSRVVIFGAMRGLQWGEALSKRNSSRKHDRHGKEWSLLKHPSIVTLLRRVPPASTAEICRALDKRGEPLPWRALPPDYDVGNRSWGDNAGHQWVKSLITRARNKVAEMDDDCLYLKSLNSNRRQFSEDVDAAKKDTKAANESGYLSGMEPGME